MKQDTALQTANYSGDQLIEPRRCGTRVSYGATGNGNAGSPSLGNGVWVECDLNTMQINGYNLLTGKQLWGPKKTYQILINTLVWAYKK